MSSREKELAAEKHELFKKFTRCDRKFMIAMGVLQRIVDCGSLKEGIAMAQSAIKQLPIDHSVDRQLPSFLQPMQEIPIEPAIKKPSVPGRKGGTVKRGPKPKEGRSLW